MSTERTKFRERELSLHFTYSCAFRSSGESGAEADGGAGFCSGGFLLAIFRRRAGFERMEETAGNLRDFVDGRQEGGFVGFGGLGEAADFAHEL
jgi:hypothetical protein